MPSDEKPLTRYSISARRGMQRDPKGKYCRASEADQARAAKDEEIAELKSTIGKFYGWRPPRDVAAKDARIAELEARIDALLTDADWDAPAAEETDERLGLGKQEEKS